MNAPASECRLNIPQKHPKQCCKAQAVLLKLGWHWSRWKKGAWSNWCVWLSKKKLLVWKAAPKTCREHIPWFCTSIESNPAWTCTSQHSWISSLAASWWRRIVERNREESRGILEGPSKVLAPRDCSGRREAGPEFSHFWVTGNSTHPKSIQIAKS